MKITKIMSNNTITLPKEIREKLKVEVGDYVKWIDEKGRITIEKGKIV